jgi:AcrR family transcriptional regulator
MMRRAGDAPARNGANLMALGLSEAAAATGVNRSTIYRAYKSGRMSAVRLETGQIEVDPAELFRVFPPIAAQTPLSSASHPHATPVATDDNTLHSNALEVEVKLLREMLDAMRDDRDAWREQAAKALAVLPLPAPATVVETPRRAWWRRLTG